ncbi:signal recognition particle-docking protein FtsY [Oceanicaulis sp. LC35]|uniref:signal recognition particle-docking protein FtsY n=1 Tax=Oceanicaulis sp. LC35 TaxID=3349635 RepID=UPI003F879FB0
MSWFKFGFGKKKQKDDASSEAPALEAPEAEIESEAPVESAVIAEVEKAPESLEAPRPAEPAPAPVDPEPELEEQAEAVAEDEAPNPDEIAETPAQASGLEALAETLATPEPVVPYTEEAELATEAEPEPVLEPVEEKKGFFARLAAGLKKSSSKLSDGLSSLFTQRKLDQEALDELEELLIAADIGAPTAAKVVARLAKDRFDKDVSDLEIREALADVVAETLQPYEQPLDMTGATPSVVVFVGVNGSGKTTTLGKIAVKMTREGADVITAAGDTFRAAAVEQLQVWSERAGAKFLSRELGADAAGLAFDAIQQGRSEQSDAVLIDTAGRLQNKAELMDELRKIIRVIRKIDDTAPHHVLLVLDGTVGSNAISQAEAFMETANVTGVIMTKLDGTAKGGALVQVAERFKLPIHFIGVGEGEADLQAFKAKEFARALAGLEG